MCLTLVRESPCLFLHCERSVVCLVAGVRLRGRSDWPLGERPLLICLPANETAEAARPPDSNGQQPNVRTSVGQQTTRRPKTSTMHAKEAGHPWRRNSEALQHAYSYKDGAKITVELQNVSSYQDFCHNRE
jgi:hypothetical protein